MISFLFDKWYLSKVMILLLVRKRLWVVLTMIIITFEIFKLRQFALLYQVQLAASFLVCFFDLLRNPIFKISEKFCWLSGDTCTLLGFMTSGLSGWFRSLLEDEGLRKDIGWLELEFELRLCNHALLETVGEGLYHLGAWWFAPLTLSR